MAGDAVLRSRSGPQCSSSPSRLTPSPRTGRAGRRRRGSGWRPRGSRRCSMVARPWRSSFCIASSSDRSHCSRADSRSPRRHRCGKAASSSASCTASARASPGLAQRGSRAPSPAPRRRRRPRPVRMRSIAWLWPMSRGRRIVPRSTSGHAEAPAVDAEHRVAGGDPEVAPQRHLEAARPRRGPRWRRSPACRGAAGSRPSGRRPPAVTRLPSALGHRLQVGARAEGALGSGEHGHGQRRRRRRRLGTPRPARRPSPGPRRCGAPGRSMVTMRTGPSSRTEIVERSPRSRRGRASPSWTWPRPSRRAAGDVGLGGVALAVDPPLAVHLLQVEHDAEARQLPAARSPCSTARRRGPPARGRCRRRRRRRTPRRSVATVEVCSASKEAAQRLPPARRRRAANASVTRASIASRGGVRRPRSRRSGRPRRRPRPPGPRSRRSSRSARRSSTWPDWPRASAAAATATTRATTASTSSPRPLRRGAAPAVGSGSGAASAGLGGARRRWRRRCRSWPSVLGRGCIIAAGAPRRHGRGAAAPDDQHDGERHGRRPAAASASGKRWSPTSSPLDAGRSGAGPAGRATRRASWAASSRRPARRRRPRGGRPRRGAGRRCRRGTAGAAAARAASGRGS